MDGRGVGGARDLTGGFGIDRGGLAKRDFGVGAERLAQCGFGGESGCCGDGCTEGADEATAVNHFDWHVDWFLLWQEFLRMDCLSSLLRYRMGGRMNCLVGSLELVG